MSHTKSIIAVLGWEDRFIEGLKRDFETHHPNRLVLVVYEDYFHMTSERYDLIKEICVRAGVEISEIRILEHDPISALGILRTAIEVDHIAGDEAILEISNMPRELMWVLLSFLKKYHETLSYIYHQPESYPEGNISREPEKPRLLLLHSGITDLSKKTAVIILTGFHWERSHQLIKYFEPSFILFGLQQGTQFDNIARNNVLHRKWEEKLSQEFKGAFKPEFFDLDAYASDNGYSVLREKLAGLTKEYNVIISSLGPKLSAIAIYRVYCEFPEIALAYVPAKYSQDYSKGIGQCFSGEITFRT
jgi:hypothetical protein